MGCGASKRGTEEVIPLKSLALDSRQQKKPQEEMNNNPTKNAKSDIHQDADDIYANTGIEDFGNRKNKGFLELSNFSDLPEYRSDHPNLNFQNGELSPIDTNRGTLNKRRKNNPDSQHFVSFEQENTKQFFGSTGPKNRDQKGKVGTSKIKKEDALNWPDTGCMEIKTISYKVVYNHEIRGFRTLKPKEHYLTSFLSWKKNQEDFFEFSIKDTSYTDLRTGNSHEVFTPEILFDVEYDGKFVLIVF